MFAAPLPGMTPAKGIFVPYPHMRKGIFSPALCHFLPMQISHPSAEGFRPSADFLSELIFAFQGGSRV